MRKLFLTALLLGAAAVLFPLQAQERFDRSGKKAVHQLTGSNVTIVLQNSSPVTRYAAEELQTILSQILGQKVPVAKVPGKEYNIYVGFGPFAEKMKLDPSKLILDGFYIKSFGKNIVIAGRDDPKANIKWSIQRGGAWSFHFERATLFGVYEFLERFCGVRFYFPNLGTVVPQKKVLGLPDMDVSERPDMPQRRYSSFWDGEYFEGDNRKATINPGKNVNLLRLRADTSYLPCCHGMNGNQLLRRFSKSNPEYFALTSNNIRRNDPDIHFAGHICFSSGVLEEIYQDMKAYLTGKDASTRNIVNKAGKPQWTISTFHKPYVDVMPQDSFFPCQCAKCKAKYEMEKGREGMASKMVWGTVNAWAKRLKAEGIPGKLSMMAYWPYRSIPEEKLEDNIVVMLAQRGPWQTNPKDIASDLDLLKKWTQKLNAKVHVWNYANKVSTQNIPGIPSWTPHAVGKYYQLSAPYIFGAFKESECDRFLYFAMNHYIFCKVAWNTKTDYTAAMEEFYALMFGAASKDMKAILNGFEDIWLNKIVGRTVNTDIGPVASIPSDNEIWNVIYSPAFLDNLDKRFDAALKKVKKGSLEAQRIELFRREFMQPLRAASKTYLERTSAVNGLQLLTGKKAELIPFQYKGKGETVRTQVSAAYTADALEITFECEEPEMAQIIAPRRKHDDPDIWRDSSVEIFLDPVGDRKVYYQLMVNYAGSITDVRYRSFGKRAVNDYTWNSGAAVKVTPGAKSCTMTISIPLKSLPGLKRSGFPINFCRNRVLAKQGTRQPLYIWSPYAKGFHDLENFGKLVDAKEELILDGSFDTLPVQSKNTHWGFYKGKVYHGWIASGAYAKGDKAVYQNKVTFSKPGALQVVSVEGKHTTFTQYFRFKFKPNTRYRIKCMAKLENVKPARRGGGFAINIWDDRNHFFPQKNLVNGTFDWTNFSFEFTTSPKVHTSPVSYMRVGLLNSTGTVYIDDLSLMEIK